MSLEVGQDGLPTSGSGSIVINDQWESLGENRRVFDYFDRYTAINQSVIVYRAIETIGDLDMPSSWTVIYTGKVESYVKDKDTISFSVAQSLAAPRKAVKLISADMAQTGYTVPSESIGKALPLVFAANESVYTPAYNIGVSLTNQDTGYYTYATYFGAQFRGTSVTTIYAKNSDGVLGSTPFSGTSSVTNTTGGNYPTSHGKDELLVELTDSTNALRGILTGVRWLCRGQNNGAITPTGNIIFTVYEAEADPISKVRIGNWVDVQSKVVAKSAYLTEVRGASDFYVNAVFADPLVAHYGLSTRDNAVRRIAVGIRLDTYTGSSTTDFTSGGVTTSSTYYTRVADTDNFITASAYVPLIEMGKATIGQSVSSTDNDGFSYPILTVTQNSWGTDKCDLQNLELGCNHLGILDDSSGTISGTGAYSQLFTPDHIIELLGYAWNGSAWADSGAYDFSTFSSLYTSLFTTTSPYCRYVKGATEGEVTFQDVVNQLVKEMCCFLVPLSNGKLALWPWGGVGSVVRTFTDADIIDIGNIDETDPSTVINNIKIAYARDYLNINDQWEQTGIPQNYTAVLLANKSSSAPYPDYLTNSESLYDKRELEDTGSQFISYSHTATTRALYFATRHEHTHRTFDVTIPYFDNTDLKLMDIVDISSVHGPSYLGSSSKARLPTYTGIENDIYKGEYAREATRRRCQIIGLSNDYDGLFPQLVMTVREIKPRHKNDPTAASF